MEVETPNPFIEMIHTTLFINIIQEILTYIIERSTWSYLTSDYRNIYKLDEGGGHVSVVCPDITHTHIIREPEALPTGSMASQEHKLV
jgi:hypothetical protein